MALVCIPPGIVSLVALRPAVNQAPAAQSRAANDGGNKRRKPRAGYFTLLAAYTLEGFGYIIGMTFFVSLVKTTTNSAALAGISWIVAGCAAAVSAPLWRAAARKGYLSMLILALLLQAVGAMLPALTTAAVSIVLAGILLGGTFMGVVVLALQYGVTLSERSSAHTVAILTGLYGVGQFIGPYVAGASAQGKSFAFAFALSSASLFLAALLLVTNTSKR
jgi:predicted MFS family arabinose efflux permease